MFDKEIKGERIETLLGEKSIITGSIKGQGLIRIDGIIDGDILWQQDIIIGITSKVNGNVSCLNATVNGFIEGNVICENTLIIESNGKVKGDITVKNVVIKEGGWLDGKCTMIVERNSSDLID